jgi:DNA-binding MarR family transcriptional regulator
MAVTEDEVKSRLLTILDRYYEKDFDDPVSVGALAEELHVHGSTIDPYLRSLQGRHLVDITNETAGGHYYVSLTPTGKDKWDRKQGKQHHLIIRQRILERLKQTDDQDQGEFTTSDSLAADLEVNRNTILINLAALEKSEWAQLKPQYGAGYPLFDVRITPEGRVAAEEPPMDINFCFVLMPFDAALDAVYDAIKAGAEDVQMRCERADKARDNQAVIEKIKRSVQKAGIIVADMTCENPNVFYEVGYAHGLGKDCILITQAQSETVPFDLRHLEHIKYSVNDKGLANLRQALIETVARVRSRPL